MGTMRLPLLLPILGLLAVACGSPVRHDPPVNTPIEVPQDEPATYEDLKPFIEAQSGQDYPLYRGDSVQIQVQGHPELKVVRKIPEDGKIPLFGITEKDETGRRKSVVVEAAGKTVPEFEAELRERYSRIIESPYVTVTVTEHAPKLIYVTGAVNSPGQYSLPDQGRLSLVQALTLAGWFRRDSAKDRVRIIRVDARTGDRVYLPPIDVGAIVDSGQVRMDIPLAPGDTITVASRELHKVFIYGEVNAPGEFEFRPGLTLTRLITMAGGLKEWAKSTDIRILRNGSGPSPKVYRIDVTDIFDEKAPDFRLKPGDVVNVDERFI